MASAPYRIAIVGVGKIARDQHVPALRADHAFDLVATASRHGSVPGVPAYPDLTSLLAAVDIDAVSICTPPGHRLEIVATALEAGLHVMLEKPPAADLETVLTMAQAAAAANRVLFTTWHSREAGAVAPARAWLQDRRIRAVQVEWRENIRQWHPGQDWILAEDGFGVFDPGINALSIVTAILPEPLALTSADVIVPEGRGSPLTADLTFTAGEASVTAGFDFLHEGPPRWDVRVETDDGAILLERGGQVLHVDGEVRHYPDQEYPRLYRRFAELLATGRSDVDAAPLKLVLDARRDGVVTQGPSFAW